LRGRSVPAQPTSDVLGEKVGRREFVDADHRRQPLKKSEFSAKFVLVKKIEFRKNCAELINYSACKAIETNGLELFFKANV
jgi:hypothetical protein